MNRAKAWGLLRRLALADAARVLRARLLAWLATAFLGWSLALLAAALSLVGPVAFHAAVMALAASLPAFLLFPFSEGLGTAALRRADSDASIEAWLDAGASPRPGASGDPPAMPALAKRASVALEVGAMRGWNLARLPRKAAWTLGAVAGLGFLAFAAAQAVSLEAGYGLSIGYPDKAQARVFQRLGADEASPYLEAPLVGQDEAKAAGQGARAARGGRAGPEDPLADPMLGLPAPDGQGEGGGADAGAGKESSGGQRGSARAAPDGGMGSEPGRDGDGGGSGAEARSPGYKGAGKAMEASPFVDYRARLERQLVEASGLETSLGEAPSAETVSEAISAWFSSFEATVGSGEALDPELRAAGQAWLEAFAEGRAR